MSEKKGLRLSLGNKFLILILSIVIIAIGG